MNHFSYYRFHRTDPAPWIPFEIDKTTTRGDVAIFWVCVAGLALILLGGI